MSATGLFKVIKASAGSGKTYTLVKEYLLLALRTSSPYYYRQILAITFTNAAAAEMKERVLLRLSEFAQPGFSSTLFEEIAEELRLTPEVLQERSSKVFSHMLHHYGLLSILTIDSFTHKIIRSFARDLHLRYDFSIEMESTAFLSQVVEMCIEDVGKDDQLTAYLEEFVFQKMEDEKSWDVRGELAKMAKKLTDESSIEPLNKLSDYTFEDFSNAAKKLRKDNKTFETELMTIANEAMSLLEKNGLNEKHFYYGSRGPIGSFKKILKGEISALNSNALKALHEDKWTTGKPDPAAAVVIPHLTLLLRQLHERTSPDALGLHSLRIKIHSKIHSLGLLQRMSEISNQLKIDNNVLLISDFHRLINQVVKENEAPFIYERIGTRYRHLLIDEFQDTSALQWSNAIPLLQNSLAENNLNLIVGDAKQAIYRWRGGNVTQFVQLPALSKDATPHGSSDFLKSHFDTITLRENYRSAKEIISFNNRFYELLSDSLSDYKSVYDDVKQNATRSSTGYVRVTKSTESESESLWEQTAMHIRNSIEESLQDGFDPGDIAILTRKGDREGGIIAQMLTEHGYQVATKESFLINASPVVRTIVAYFDILTHPEKKFPKIELVRSLSAIHKQIDFQKFVREYTHREGRETIIRLDDYLTENFGDQSTIQPSLSVFSQAISMLRYFKLEADTNMEFLLAKIQDRCTSHKMPLSAFLIWWHEQKAKLFTSSVASSDSIQIMTIHKSKGLQFPVVIYPRFKSGYSPGEMWISTDIETVGLPAALLDFRRKSKPSEVTEPKEFIEEENSSRLDDMNTCYVATTRAEERLYMVVEEKCSTWLSKEIESVLIKNFDGYEGSGQWESGSKEKNTREKKVSTLETIQYSGENYLQPQLRIQSNIRINKDSIDYGTRLHACLAEITTAADIERAVLRAAQTLALNDGTILQNLQHDLQRLLSNKNIQHWFEEGLEVVREKELCTKEGKVLRPDRIVISDAQIDIIDYKTGVYSSSHEMQVREYVAVLTEMYDKTVRGFLIYTQSGEVVEVSLE
jgi:ATP-dependent exoDNAse (exonuclease V) beta subunit